MGSQPRTRRSLKVLSVWPGTAKQATADASRAIGTRSMSDFSTELARLMTARGVGVRELARAVPCNPGHISNLRSGKARPSPELGQALDQALAASSCARRAWRVRGSATLPCSSPCRPAAPTPGWPTAGPPRC